MSECIKVPYLPTCSFCAELAHFNGKTTMGPWADMCPTHFDKYGVELGTGYGQMLIAEQEPDKNGTADKCILETDLDKLIATNITLNRLLALFATPGVSIDSDRASLMRTSGLWMVYSELQADIIYAGYSLRNAIDAFTTAQGERE